MDDVEAFRSRQHGETLAMIDRLRGIVAAANPALVERIKWNAPSFAIVDDDRITLGVAPKGGVRLVLHRGVKPKPLDGFAFDDPDGLAKWSAPDRGVIAWKTLAEIDATADALSRLCARWIAQVDGTEREARAG